MSTALLEPILRSDHGPRPLPALLSRLTASSLCLAVALIHVKDQGGFPGAKEPTYVGIGYYLLELAAVVGAVLLLRRTSRKGWFLSLGVAIGPLIGYVMSRGPGLPLYRDDRGNWTEPLGVISIVVEGVLLLLSFAAVRRQDTVASRSGGPGRVGQRRRPDRAAPEPVVPFRAPAPSQLPAR